MELGYDENDPPDPHGCWPQDPGGRVVMEGVM